MLDTITFELPFGVEGKDGVVHTTVVMRPMTGADQLAVARDAEVKQLAKDGVDYTIDLGAMQSGVDSFGGLTLSGQIDPIRNFIARAAVVQMNTIMFTQVVISVGDIEKPDRSIFRQMRTADLMRMEVEHGKLNGIDAESLAKLKDKAGDKPPLS